ALKGMGHVALSNRWAMIFSFLAILASFIALTLGANIWQLALVTQCFVLIGILRSRTLLRWVNDKRPREFRGFALDNQIIRWASEPFFKGLAVNLANSGIIQLGAIIYARHATVADAAAFMFTLRMLLT